MIELAVNGLAKNYGIGSVLDDVSFEIHTSEKIGIVGSNGCGKTTVFRIICGLEQADSGQVFLRKNCRIGYLQQETDQYAGNTAQQIIKNAFKYIISLQDKMKKLENMLSDTTVENYDQLTKEYGSMATEFELKGGYQMDVELAKITTGLDLPSHILQQNFELLSGGEKNRVLLAKILLEKPDVLLLDEPTNHLDIQAGEWLEEYLKTYPGAALIISHDRYFLDKAVTSIIEIEGGKAINYTGNYSAYSAERTRRLDAEFEQFKNIQKKIKAMKAAAERFRVWGRINPDNSAHFARAKRLEARIKELQKINRPDSGKKIKLSFAKDKRSGNDVIIAKNLSKQFADKHIFTHTDFLLRYGEKLAFIGANGSGKSTFIKMALGLLEPNSGSISLGANIRCGWLQQDITFPDENSTVIDLLRSLFPIAEGEARNILAGFQFRKNDVFKKISALSGGEKVRLKLCILMQQNLNLLLLDEPTNHLDIQSREVVEDALLDFSGTIFFISHDRFFINKIAHSLVALENCQMIRYPGNYDYYHQIKMNQNASICQKTPLCKKKISQQQTQKTNPIIIEKLENEISLIESQINDIDQQIEIHASDYQKLLSLFDKKEELDNYLESLLNKWENLNH